MWMTGSSGLARILDGFYLSDHTFIKGFHSFSADAHIVKVKLERLPYLPTAVLKLEMESRLSRFGEILDLGIYKTSSGCYIGQGYATLNVTPATLPEAPYEALQQVILWSEDDGRQVLLQYDNMPDFCRLCQSSDHCRADCPEYKLHLKCHNCNGNGHIMRNCPRRNDAVIDVIPASHKKRLVDKQKKERKLPALPNPPAHVSQPRNADVNSPLPTMSTDTVMQIVDDTLPIVCPPVMSPPAPFIPPQESSKTVEKTGDDTVMTEKTDSTHNDRHNSAHDVPAIFKAIKSHAYGDVSDRRRSYRTQDQSTLTATEISQLEALSSPPRQTTIRIATLNCRGLKKTNNPQLRKQFIRSLRKSHYDIICLQETHANDSTIIITFNMQFQTKPSIWTSHCGISNNDKFTLSPVVPSNLDDRFIFASIQLDDTIIAYVLNLYAPAFVIGGHPIADDLHNSRSSSGSLQGIPNEWLQLLDTFYTDCFQDSKQVTWHRGDLSSTIDFVFCSRPSSPFITETDQQFINTHWTDRDLLPIRYQFADVFGKGPGVFKANPFLAKNRLQ
ncbi:MAG: hypothetical protein EXX96DRAFT_630868 [Benjaminiella poitrasii]|nr:MAG: hypothetical protein EXX96DRAFT_630868 [Benjaminiella poitrasii]